MHYFEYVHEHVQEGDEVVAASMLGDHGRELAGHRIQCAEDGHAPVLSRRGHDQPLAAAMPGVRQSGIKMELGLVAIK
jgi:hypothetical protein